MDTPTISVIIPIYNTASTLPRCIDSVLAQKLDNMEIVLVDDGSPDHAGELADDYASRHECITVLHQPNRGLAEARRAGILAARGTYVMHVDSDDTLPAAAVSRLLREAQNNGLDMVWGAYRRVSGDKATIVRHPVTGIMSGRELLDYVLDLSCICASWGSVSRRQLWLNDVFPPHALRLPGEDVFTHIKLTQFVDRVGLIDDVVYDYHYNPVSLTALGPLHRQELWKQYFALVRDNLRQRGLLDELEQRVRVLEVDRLAFNCATIDRSDPWYGQVIAYPTRSFPPKHRVLHCLLHWPRLLRLAIAARRLLPHRR